MGTITLIASGDYNFNHKYLSKEENKRFIHEWPEFRNIMSFIAKTKKTLQGFP